MIEELDPVLLRNDQLAVRAGPELIKALQIAKPSTMTAFFLTLILLRTDTFFLIYERLSVTKKHSQNLAGGGGGVLPIMWSAYQKLQVKSFLFKTGSSSHTVS